MPTITELALFPIIISAAFDVTLSMVAAVGDHSTRAQHGGRDPYRPSLGFLGLGAQPPLLEWGVVINSGCRYMIDSWWGVTFPGIAISCASLGFNLLVRLVRK